MPRYMVLELQASLIIPPSTLGFNPQVSLYTGNRVNDNPGHGLFLPFLGLFSRLVLAQCAHDTMNSKGAAHACSKGQADGIGILFNTEARHIGQTAINRGSIPELRLGTANATVPGSHRPTDFSLKRWVGQLWKVAGPLQPIL